MISVSLRRGLCALGVAGFLATPAAVAEETYSPEELQQVALASLSHGNPSQTLAIAEALLARDATDVVAHRLRAAALRDMARHKEALSAARTAWKLSQSDADKYSSALMMAQVLSTADKKTRAQLWLRRAVEHAPHPALAHKAKRDFKYVQQRNPWQTHLSFTLAPNSNINNGSARETSRLNYAISDLLELGDFDLTGASLALSGFEYGAQIDTRYRFSQTETTAHDLQLNLTYRSFTLSNSAKNIAPDASGSDFAFGYASLGYAFKRLINEGRAEFSADADINQSWYGGARYASGVSASVAQTYRLSPTGKFRFTAHAQTSNGQRTYDSERLTLSTYWDRRLSSGDGVSMSLSLSAQQSPTDEAEYLGFGVRSAYSMGKPVMGAVLQFGLGASFRDYDISPHDPSGREDLRISADLTAVFKDIDYYGFNPSLTLSASSTVSNINLYDSNRVGLSIGIRSAF